MDAHSVQGLKLKGEPLALQTASQYWRDKLLLEYLIPLLQLLGLRHRRYAALSAWHSHAVPSDRRYDATASALELQDKYAHLEPGEEVELEGDAMEAVRGRIIARRAFGKLVFCSLNDESGSIQVGAHMPPLDIGTRLSRLPWVSHRYPPPRRAPQSR